MLAPLYSVLLAVARIGVEGMPFAKVISFAVSHTWMLLPAAAEKDTSTMPLLPGAWTDVMEIDPLRRVWIVSQ